jgi:hypothetical protein
VDGVLAKVYADAVILALIASMRLAKYGMK